MYTDCCTKDVQEKVLFIYNCIIYVFLLGDCAFNSAVRCVSLKHPRKMTNLQGK